jgi:hypothetical protein
MRQRITSSLQLLIADRPLLIVLALFLVGCIGLLIYLATNIHPSDLQIVTHYTSFGTTNFYRDKWYYLLNFVVFVIVMAIVHVVLCYRILVQKGHDAAIAFAWLGVVLVVISAGIVYQVLKIASLT